MLVLNTSMFALQPNTLLTGTRLLPLLLVIVLWLATTALAKPRPDEPADDGLAPGSQHAGQWQLSKLKRTARGFAHLSEEARLELYLQLQGQGRGSELSHHGNGRNRTERSLGKGRKRPSFLTQMASGGGKGGEGGKGGKDGKDDELDEEDRDLGFSYFETCPIFDCFCFGLCPKQKDKDLVKKCETGCSPGIVDFCRKGGGCAPGPGVTTTVKPKPATCDQTICTCSVICILAGPLPGPPSGTCANCIPAAKKCKSSGKCP